MNTDKLPLYLNPVPMDLAWNDPEENLLRMETAIEARLSKCAEGAPEEQLFVFPEVTLTAFVTENPQAFAIEPPHEFVRRLCELARRRRTGLVAGFPELNPADAKKPYNAAVLIGADGRIAARYRKLHLFTFGKTPESERYSAGDTGTVCLYRGWNIGLSICFDIRFSRLYYEYAKAGVDLITASSCWVGGEHKTYQYKTINSAHAVLTQAYVIAVNRAGRDPNFEYDGSAYVFSPYGENLFNDEPVALDEKMLAECRKLVVRPSDRDAYPIDFNTGEG